MWDLDDTASYAKVASFDFPWASTYADMRPGHTDKEKRERVRAIAANQLPSSIPHAKWWAFRIFVRKAGGRPFDIENTLKVFIDSFSARQIRSDASQYQTVALYEDDTVDHVRIIQVGGERTSSNESTRVEIFAKIEN